MKHEPPKQWTEAEARRLKILVRQKVSGAHSRVFRCARAQVALGSWQIG
jgi:hypothetical protein